MDYDLRVPPANNHIGFSHRGLSTYDRAQIEDLYANHRVELQRYLNRHSGDRDEIADALQETYLRLIMNPPAHEQNVRAWLFTVATNVLRDNARRRHAEFGLLEHDGQNRNEANEHTPDARLELEARRRTVRQTLARLPHRERTVLLMRSEGFLHREIAEAVGTTTGSIGTIIFRALKKLSRYLAETPEDYL